jgi:hypothetical protein
LFLYSYLGTLGQLGLNLARGKTHPRVFEYWIWLGGFATAAIILIMLGRIALRLLQHVQQNEDPASTEFGASVDLAIAPCAERSQRNDASLSAGETHRVSRGT